MKTICYSRKLLDWIWEVPQVSDL